MAVSTNDILAGTTISNPANVYTTSNIANATTNPTPAPDDLLGIRNQINQELGIENLQNTYQTAFQDVLKAKQAARTQQTGLEGLGGESVNFIRGAQAQASRLSSDQIAALAETAQVAQSALQAAQQEAASRFDIRQSEVNQKRQLILQYPGAKITFGDSFDSIAGKLDKYQKEQEKKVYKDTLKAKALELGLKTKGSIKELEKRLRKSSKEAAAAAKAEADLKRRAMEADIANTYSQISARGKGVGAKTESEMLQSDLTDSQEEFKAVAGADGYVDPIDYNRQKAAWSLYQDPSKFDEYFQMYINPSEAKKYNITKTSSQLLGQ